MTTPTMRNPMFQAAGNERQHQRHMVQLPARLVTVGSGLQGTTSRACRLMDISVGGASVYITNTIGLPDHYYLSIIGFDERIGCAEIYRNGNRIGLSFIRELPPHLFAAILKADRVSGVA